MSGPAVSVIIPTRNRPAFVPVAVTSVLAQTFRDLEVIVVDDASDPPASDALAGIDDERLRILRHDTNVRLPAARNSALAVARGRWIAFLDDDNTWEPTFLETLHAAGTDHLSAGSEDHVVVASAARVIDDVTGTTYTVSGAPEGPTTFATIVGGTHPLVSSLLVPRAVIDAHGDFTTTLTRAEDLDLMLRWAVAGVPFVHVAEPLLVRRYHRRSMSFDHTAAPAAERLLQDRWRDEIAERLGRRVARRWSARRWIHLHAGATERHLENGERGRAVRSVVAMTPFSWADPGRFGRSIAKVTLGLDRYRAIKSRLRRTGTDGGRGHR